MNLYSSIGLVILVGIATKNGILIVEFANQLRDEGKGWQHAVVEAASLRLRPILMTGLSTAIGALPLLLASGAGAEGRVAIGLVVLFGVLLSTALTLVVVPGTYGLVSRFAASPLHRTRVLQQQLAATGEAAALEVEGTAAVVAGKEPGALHREATRPHGPPPPQPA
jgi:multidrug efflux pump